VTVHVVRGLFALSVALAAAALAAAALAYVSRRALLAVCGAIGALAVAAWIAFAFDPSAAVGVPAGAILVSLLAASAALGVEWGVRRNRRLERDISVAEARLRTVIDREAQERATELEHALARARADSASLLAEEERRIADERRAAIVARERAAAREIADALAETQRRVEQRLAEWTEDLERAQEHLAVQVRQLGARQQRMLSDAEERLRAVASDLESQSDAQRANLVKLREDVARDRGVARGGARGARNAFRRSAPRDPRARRAAAAARA
jgi:hypothetical protein